MATTISFTVPDPIAARILAAYGNQRGYQATINGSPNPQTLSQFTKTQIFKDIKQVVKTNESGTAAETARANQNTQVDSDMPDQ